MGNIPEELLENGQFPSDHKEQLTQLLLLKFFEVNPWIDRNKVLGTFLATGNNGMYNTSFLRERYEQKRDIYDPRVLGVKGYLQASEANIHGIAGAGLNAGSVALAMFPLGTIRVMMREDFPAFAHMVWTYAAQGFMHRDPNRKLHREERRAAREIEETGNPE